MPARYYDYSPWLYDSPRKMFYYEQVNGGLKQSRYHPNVTETDPYSTWQYESVLDHEQFYEPSRVSQPSQKASKFDQELRSRGGANRVYPKWQYETPLYHVQIHEPLCVRQPSTTARSPQKATKGSYATKARKATEEDACRAGIPSGYSIKNWDPTEAPILLLGSVFDANSLGKWIYDWTVYHHGPSTPLADVAGDLWLLLIKLAGKMKRAEECLQRIRSIDSQEMVEDFIESGSRLWQRFKELLKACEKYMWRAPKREGVSMGKNAGIEFVDSIFGRDRQLENAEKLMNSMRLWNMRFDTNCEELIRKTRVGHEVDLDMEM
jgi:hypothetical protein